MTLELKIADCLCWASTFIINGQQADSGDFGSHYDADHENAEEYGCGNKVFEREPPTASVLTKYGITVEEYHEIAAKLEEGLSFGRCGLCS